VTQSDVLVIGGGVIGLTTAWELAGQGVRTAVVDRGDFGREASWAGAGILPPGNLESAATAEARLRALSHRLWPELSRALLEKTGIDNGYQQCGGVEVVEGDESRARTLVEAYRREGVEATWFPARQAADLEPALAGDRSVVHLPGLCQVRNPRHLKALVAACGQAGVVLRPFTELLELREDGRTVVAVTTSGRLMAERVVLCTGAWSGLLGKKLGVRVPVEPVRGQMALLRAPAGLLRRVVLCGRRYLVPRPDGLVLVGSTEASCGFDKRTTATAVSQLLQFAQQLVPALAEAEVVRAWAGLRPGSPDGLPLIGRLPNFERTYVATGHFRSGLQMSPGTARLVRELLLEQAPSIPLEPYSVTRPTVRAPDAAFP